MPVLPTHPLQPAKMKLHQPACMSHSSYTCHGQKWWRTKEAIGILGIQEVRQRAPKRPSFFSLVEGGMGFSDFCCCQCVLIMLPKFPIGFHNVFPGSQCVPQQHLTLFHNLCPKFYSCNLQAAQKENTNCTKLDLFFWWATQWCPSQKEKKNFGALHY
jgi:hypothetical protein